MPAVRPLCTVPWTALGCLTGKGNLDVEATCLSAVADSQIYNTPHALLAYTLVAIGENFELCYPCAQVHVDNSYGGGAASVAGALAAAEACMGWQAGRVEAEADAVECRARCSPRLVMVVGGMGRRQQRACIECVLACIAPPVRS